MAYQTIPPSSAGQTDEWATEQEAFLQAAIPTLSAFQFIKIGQAPGGTALATQAVDGGVEGGGYGVASDTLWLRYTSSVYLTPKTGVWGIAFEAKLPTITSAKTAYLGLVNAASTNLVGVGAVFASSQTHFVLHIVGGTTTSATSTQAGDTSLHTFAITFDLTTVTLYVDGVSVATQTTLTNLTDQAMQLGGFCSASLTPGVVTKRVIFGTV